jgi:probable rRNA maturation factor
MNSLNIEINLIIEPGANVSPEEKQVEALVRFALAGEGATGDWEIAVVLTTDRRLRDLHREFMGIDAETDVITFPSDPIEGESEFGGDIVISVDRAAEQGSELGHTLDQEIEHLIVHGLLHLCGWDDHDDSDREKMIERQDGLIAGFNDRLPQSSS